MADENRPSEQQQKQDDTTAAQARPETAQKQSSGVSADTSTEKKIIYSLCYLWGILFFLPLILYKNDAKATRHANEGLLLLLFSVVGNAVFGILMRVPAIGWIFGVLAGIYSLALLIRRYRPRRRVAADRFDPPLKVKYKNARLEMRAGVFRMAD